MHWYVLVGSYSCYPCCCHTCSQEDFAFVQYLETLLMLEVLTSSFPVPYHDDFDMFLGPNSCTFRMRGKTWHDLWHFLFLGMCLMHLVFEADDLRVCFFHSSWESLINNDSFSAEKFLFEALKPPWSISCRTNLQLPGKETPGYFADYGGSFQVSQDPGFSMEPMFSHTELSVRVVQVRKKSLCESICTCGIQRFIMFDSWGPFVSSKSCIEARTSRESILSCSAIRHFSHHSWSLDPNGWMVRVRSLHLLFVDSKPAEVHIMYWHIFIYFQCTCINYILYTHTYIYIVKNICIFYIHISRYISHLLISWVRVWLI